MSDMPTPLTDALADRIGGYGHRFQLSKWKHHARQLETRCAELEEAVREGITGPYIDRLAENTALAAGLDKADWHTWTDINDHIAELRRDRERLYGKFMDALRLSLGENWPDVFTILAEDVAAIDAVMRDSQTGNEEEL